MSEEGNLLQILKLSNAGDGGLNMNVRLHIVETSERWGTEDHLKGARRASAIADKIIMKFFNQTLAFISNFFGSRATTMKPNEEKEFQN